MACSPAKTRSIGSSHTGMTIAVRTSGSIGALRVVGVWRSAKRSRPRSRMKKPRVAVQKPIEIQPKSAPKKQRDDDLEPGAALVGENVDHEPGGDDARNQNQTAEQQAAPPRQRQPREGAPLLAGRPPVRLAVLVARQRRGGAVPRRFDAGAQAPPAQAVGPHRTAPQARCGAKVAVLADGTGQPRQRLLLRTAGQRHAQPPIGKAVGSVALGSRPAGTTTVPTRAPPPASPRARRDTRWSPDASPPSPPRRAPARRSAREPRRERPGTPRRARRPLSSPATGARPAAGRSPPTACRARSQSSLRHGMDSRIDHV